MSSSGKPTRPTEIRYANGVVGRIIYKPHLKLDGREVSAWCEAVADGGHIRVNASRSEAWQAQALLHEILHKALRPIVSVDHDEDIEETIVYTIERNLTALWAANPELFTWLHAHFTAVPHA